MPNGLISQYQKSTELHKIGLCGVRHPCHCPTQVHGEMIDDDEMPNIENPKTELESHLTS